jgi:micrococcal nuclease
MENITYSDTIVFVPPIEQGKVIKIYDGDTITIATKLPLKYDEEDSPYYRYSIRLNGIDCPEMRTKNAEEKECAILVRDYLRSLLTDKIVILKNVEVERKYGRLLADVYLGDVNICELLLSKNMAVKYNGGTKECPDNWMTFYNEKNETV